ncbi:hypothetical protein ASPCADRAFT_210452 [Aspergillus carbonarius ITEM 5010]|uniref:Uncharacterized protein n=1 Tax=Aspergillus carbonarius (strain ITEM 5010) TaxID=602072 RepID=A0A1R3RC37_ASPC5|nr:hypothetical protein ASPCADRAFT_210452 [Aspergillus carbonarius ITEM 5010]
MPSSRIPSRVDDRGSGPLGGLQSVPEMCQIPSSIAGAAAPSESNVARVPSSFYQLSHECRSGKKATNIVSPCDRTSCHGYLT